MFRRPAGRSILEVPLVRGTTAVTARETIHLYASLADLKDVMYKNTLGLTALIELLVQKGVISKEEIALTAQKLDASGD